MAYYVVIGLDGEGYDVAGGTEWDTLSEARRAAKRLVAEKEAIAAGLVKVEARRIGHPDRLGECIVDYFVNG